MSRARQVVSIVPSTPQAPEMSRRKLKQLAHWIRDDLDIVVAREGPDILRPDDVLALHEIFVALHQSTTITALDLRATGIHRAVKDVAGIATRWPARLCDDCDRIIAVWTSKFGPLDHLHPFLYGRHGRLEGIAHATECTRDALLKRWSENCPERIHPSVSHRHGGLGFRAGDWWINSLFAHYAGIIGLESVEGGTTHDDNGAYALVLTDAERIYGQSEEYFTYHCLINDKGKYRLTAATVTSREPVRVLRSHSINSIWGPRAGIRYEGLFSVSGWCIRQAKLEDFTKGEWKERQIIYEVTMQRVDTISVEEISRRPTTMEVDDYAEYKRLRKLYRAQRHERPLPMGQQVLQVATPSPSLQLLEIPTRVSQSLSRVPSSVSFKTTFEESAFGAVEEVRGSCRPLCADLVSPMTTSRPQNPLCASKKAYEKATPSITDKAQTSPTTSSDTLSCDKHIRTLSSGAISITSSIRSGQGNLKEIAPWFDLEAAQLPISLLVKVPELVKEEDVGLVMGRLEIRAAEMDPVKKVKRSVKYSKQPSDVSLRSQQARQSDTETTALDMGPYSATPIGQQMKTDEEVEKSKVIFGDKPRYYDGAECFAGDKEEHSTLPHSYVDSMPNSLAVPIPQERPQTFIRPNDSSFFLHYGIEDIEFASPLDSLLSSPKMATPVNSPMSPPRLVPGKSQTIRESIALGKLKCWLNK